MHLNGRANHRACLSIECDGGLLGVCGVLAVHLPRLRTILSRSCWVLGANEREEWASVVAYLFFPAPAMGTMFGEVALPLVAATVSWVSRASA